MPLLYTPLLLWAKFNHTCPWKPIYSPNPLYTLSSLKEQECAPQYTVNA